MALDESPGISRIEVAKPVCACLYLAVILMSEPAKVPSQAAFGSVIRYVRTVKAGLDKLVSGLDQPTEAALGYANGMQAGLDTTLITLEHLARIVPKRLHKLVVCDECQGAYFADTPHDCGGLRNAFYPDDLDRLLGSDGYVVKYPNGDTDHQWDNTEPMEGDAEFETEDAAAPDADEPDETEIAYETPTPLGMREGSKKHRVYEATRTLLEQNGPMHIDDMLENIMALGVFAGVKNPRVNFANLLSQFRNKRLVESDYQGTYSLPNRKATD